MIGCDVKYDLRARRDGPATLHRTGRVASDERCCTMGIITGGTKEYAITNDHCGTNTIVQHTHLSDISGINLNFLISAP